MKYYIQRGVNEYGPYTLADLQRYVAQGNIAMSDLARSEGMTEWVPVSNVLGDIPVPVTTPAVPAGGGTVYGGTSPYGAATAPAMSTGPIPTDFHWALVLLVNFLCGLFRVVWLFIEASFVKKIMPNSNFLVFMVLGKCVEVGAVIGFYVGIGVAAANGHSDPPGAVFLVCFLIGLAGLATLYVGIFKMRAAMEEYYNTVEPINLQLNPLLTFFFPTFYFQHHLSRIAAWKKTGVLAPQG